MFKMLTFSLAIQFFAGSAWAADYHFVRIWHPLESDKYHIGSNIAGTGILFMPQANAKEDLSVRVRMYRPVEGDFEVFQEETTNAGIPFPAQPGTYQYAYDLQRKGLLMKPGKYVYRIDCFDVSDDKPKLLASSSVFLTAVDANAKNAAPDGKLQRPPREDSIARRSTRGFDMHFARISGPIDIAGRGRAVEKVAVGGFAFMPDAEARDDLDVHVRLYRPVNGDLEVIQEVPAEIKAGPPGEPGLYSFACDLKPTTPLKSGKYLVRVDCLNKRDSQPSLWASASEFLTIAAERD